MDITGLTANSYTWTTLGYHLEGGGACRDQLVLDEPYSTNHTQVTIIVTIDQ